MRRGGWRGMFLLAVLLAAALSLCYRVTEERGLLQTGKELEEELPLCSVETEEQMAAFTFEVTDETGQVSELLDLLSQHGSSASFFVTGEWAGANQDLAAEIVRLGNDLGCLGEICRDMSLLGRKEAAEELEQGAELLQDLQEQAGTRQSLLFRAPYGEVSDELLHAARNAGFTVVGWNVDSMDWKGYGTDAVVKLVLQKNELKKGSIVRFHAEAEDTPDAVERILQEMETTGWQAVSVSRLAGEQ